MLAEFRGLNRAIEPIEVGDEPPAEITLQADLHVSWGTLRPEEHVFRLDRIEPNSGFPGRAIYVPA
jgi:hypothetical protein